MLDHRALRAILPHGHPNLLVDRVLEIDASRAVGVKAITASDPCFRGLGRDDPHAYPSSLIMESFGQTGAILWLHGLGAEARAEGRILLFGKARRCRFGAAVYPGAVLRHEAVLEHVVGDTAFVEGVTLSDGREVASFGTMVVRLTHRSAIGREND